MIVNIMNNMMITAPTFGKAISDPVRFEIMLHLCCVWLNVSDIVDKLDGKVKQPTVSHHLRELEEVGLVLSRQEGRQRFYTLNQEQANVCCGHLFRAFNPGKDVQVTDTATIPIDSIP